MAQTATLVEQPTALSHLKVLVPETTEPEAKEPPVWRLLARQVGRARHLRVAATLAWRVKRCRSERDRYEAMDKVLTAKVRERLDQAGVQGLVFRGQHHPVRVRMTSQAPRQVQDPVMLLTALGADAARPGLIKGLSLDWDQLDRLARENPELAEALTSCVTTATERRPVLIDRLA
jgi:hypothetical protein